MLVTPLCVSRTTAPNRYNRVALDTNTMSNNTDIENNVSSVVPTKGALVRASFDTRIGVRALLTVTRGNQPVWFSTLTPDAPGALTSTLVSPSGWLKVTPSA